MRPSSPFGYNAYRKLEGLPHVLYLDPASLALPTVCVKGLYNQQQWRAEAPPDSSLVHEILTALRCVPLSTTQARCP